MATHDPELAKELDAALQTRKELGPEYEAEFGGLPFLEKLDKAVDQRVRRQLAERQMTVARGAQPRGPQLGSGSGFGSRMGFAVISLVLAVPLSAISVVNAGLPGLLVAWAGIVGVNAVQATGRIPGFGRNRDRTPRDEWGD